MPRAPTTENRRQTRSGRFYDIEDAEGNIRSFPSVTTILQIIAKPALLNWMAKTEREMVIEVSADLYETIHGTPKISRNGWVTTLQDRIGKTKAGHKALAAAGEIGTQAHKLIEWNLHKMLGQVVGPEPQVQEKSLWAFMSWEDWAKAVNLKPKLIEQVVYSQSHCYAGTMDLFGTVELAGLIGWFEKKKLAVPELLKKLAKKQKTALALADWKTGKAIYAESYLQNAAYRRALRDMGHGDADLGLIIRLPKVDTDPEFEVAVCPPEQECMPVFLAFLEGWKWNQKQEEAYEAKKGAATPPKQVEQKLTESVAARAEAEPGRLASIAAEPGKEASTESEAGKSAPSANGDGPMAPVPADIPIPNDAGRGKLESFKLTKDVAKLYQGGLTLYVRRNPELQLEKHAALLFEILEGCVGQECVFTVVKAKARKGFVYEVIGALQIGPYHWTAEGAFDGVR